MSSIFGIIHNDEMDGEIVRNKMETMCELTKHRGFNQKDMALYRKVALGVNSLFETDKQRTIGFANDCYCILHGTIVNFNNFTDDICSTECSSSAFSFLYAKYGSDFVKKLSGAFVLAIYDEKDNSLHLWRDQLGVELLYYYHQGNTLIFATEIKAIYSILDEKPAISFSALDDILRYRVVYSDNDTVFVQIKKVMPGEHVIFKNGNVKRDQYWELEANAQHIDKTNKQKQADVEEFTELFEKVMKQYLKGEVFGGFFTSGGLDSSLINAASFQLGSKNYTQPITMRFSPNPVSDEEYCLMLEKIFNVKFEWVDLTDEIARKTLVEISTFQDEPVEAPGQIGTYLMAQRARELGIKSIITGDGSDEIFLGYYRYTIWENTTDKRRYNSLIRTMSSVDADFIYNDTAKEALNSKKYAPEQVKNIDEALVYERRFHFPQNHGARLDIMTMANGIEVRTPLLDNRIVEFTFKLSTKELLGGIGKRFLKSVAAKYLPQNLIHRNKQVFPSLPSQWLRDSGIAFAKEILLDSSSYSSRFFKKDALEDLINKHASGERDIGRALWGIMTVDLWYENLKNWNIKL